MPAAFESCFCFSRNALKGSAPACWGALLLTALALAELLELGANPFFSMCALNGSEPVINAGTVGTVVIGAWVDSVGASLSCA